MLYRRPAYRPKSVAEGEGFEPPARLPVRLISSQVPLTTQPPFHSLLINNLQLENRFEIDNLILQFDIGGMKHEGATKKNSQWSKTQYANLIRYIPSRTYFARIRVHG